VTILPTLDHEPDLLAAARAGDHAAFTALLVPHRRALHLYCYRMLGSLDDADDALQEAQLLAWRGLDTFAGRAPLRHWLYRITTTTCLKIIRTRGRVPLPAGDLVYLQPYPDRMLDQLTAADTDPAAEVERRDSVALAFILALQRLPPLNGLPCCCATCSPTVRPRPPSCSTQASPPPTACCNAPGPHSKPTTARAQPGAGTGRWTPPTVRS
jgi:DNA-directed RNA polymerase specialized sigma24 family protein